MIPDQTSLSARFTLSRPGFTLAVDLRLPGQGVTAIFGPSGCGKTTLLRCIAGLDRAPEGELHCRGQAWQDDKHWVPPHRRALGYVFQEASLFPHLSVLGNLRYAQKRARQQSVSLEQAIALLGIEPLLERKPEALSGGERQRASIARALAASPELLLMDEPLAALDFKRKQEILPYLEKLHEELAIPILYVSHAPDEVARLADHLVLMDQGKVVASGPLTETLCRLDLPPAFADDAGVVLITTLAVHEDDGLSRLDFPGGSIHVSLRPEALGSRLRCRVHARDVSLSLVQPTQSSILNTIPATVVDLAPTNTPGHVLVRLAAGETALLARITERSRRQLNIVPGLALWAQVKAVALLG